MDPFEVRRFRRDDREQVTALVNAHAQAVVPGVTASVNAVLRQLEREPGETIVDPWVRERLTLVAEQGGAVVAAAHLLRYGADSHVGQGYRDLGELRWLVCAVPSPSRPGPLAAGRALVDTAVAWLERSGARRIAADGALPVPGVYGVPENWPHIRELLAGSGFVPGDRVEDVYLADLADVARPSPPRAGLEVSRTLGVCGTRFTAVEGGDEIGYIEVELLGTETGPTARQAGWADVGNLFVTPSHRRTGIATWLFGEAAAWLRLARVDRLLDYRDPEDADAAAYGALLEQAGFTRLTRTTREWVRAAR